MSLDDDDFKSSFPRFGSLDDAHVTAPARHVTIVLGSGEKLSISVRALEPCALLAGAIQVDSQIEEIRLDEVGYEEWTLISEYLRYYEDKPPPQPLPCPLISSSLRGFANEWDCNFIEALDIDQLMRLMIAASYLGISNLVELTCAQLATFVRGKGPQAIRASLGLPEPTKEQMARLREFFPNLM